MTGRTPHGGMSRLNPSSERDRHLVNDGRPKRILSLDGGGVRGMVSIGILSELEQRLARRSPDPAAFRLCHYFDLIGGTSTGSIIAALLAMGWSVKEIEDLYLDLAPRVFSKSQALGIRKPKFSHKELESIIKTHTHGVTLDSDRLKTGFAMFAKRIDTGSAWTLFNHPDSKYWEPSRDQDFRPNRLYELGGLVRASAAAPYFFDAAEILIAEAKPGAFGEEHGIFLDGAVGGANNPSVQLLTIATLKDYPFQWPVGADRLYMVSVGTGSRRERRKPSLYRKLLFVRKAIAALQSMIYDTGLYAITTMQALSRPPEGSKIGRWAINSEIETMPSGPIADPPLCTFLRLDASLEPEAAQAVLEDEFRTRRGKVKQKKLDKAIDALPLIDNGRPDNLARLLRLGKAAGAKLTDADFPSAFDLRP